MSSQHPYVHPAVLLWESCSALRVEEAIPVLVRVTLCEGEVFIFFSFFVYPFASVPTAGHKFEVNRVLGLLTAAVK